MPFSIPPPNLLPAGTYRRKSCGWNQVPTRPLAHKLRLLLKLVLKRVARTPKFKSTLLLMQRGIKSVATQAKRAAGDRRAQAPSR